MIARYQPDQTREAGGQGPRSLSRLMTIFEILAADPNGRTLTDIGRALSSPKSSVLNLLRPLVTAGYLDHGEGRYRLGPSMLKLAGAIFLRHQFASLARPYLTTLTQRTGETAMIAVLDEDADVIVYVDTVDSKAAIRFTVTIGQTRPLYATVAGKVLLAHQPEAYVQQYLSKTKLVAFTGNTVASKSLLIGQLRDIERKGYATTRSEFSDDASGVAAPVFDHNGAAIAAIGIGGPTARVVSSAELIRTEVLKAASAISALMGYGGKSKNSRVASSDDPEKLQTQSASAAPGKRSFRRKS